MWNVASLIRNHVPGKYRGRLGYDRRGKRGGRMAKPPMSNKGHRESAGGEINYKQQRVKERAGAKSANESCSLLII